MASLHNHTHHPPLLRLTPQAPSETASDPSTSEFIFMILSAPPFKLPFAIQFWSNNETIFLSQDSFICLNFFWTPINHKCPFIWYAKDQHRPLAIHIHRKKPQHETTHLIKFFFITWVSINVLTRVCMNLKKRWHCVQNMWNTCCGARASPCLALWNNLQIWDFSSKCLGLFWLGVQFNPPHLPYLRTKFKYIYRYIHIYKYKYKYNFH